MDEISTLRQEFILDCYINETRKTAFLMAVEKTFQLYVGCHFLVAALYPSLEIK